MEWPIVATVASGNRISKLLHKVHGLKRQIHNDSVNFLSPLFGAVADRKSTIKSVLKMKMDCRPLDSFDNTSKSRKCKSTQHLHEWSCHANCTEFHQHNIEGTFGLLVLPKTDCYLFSG